MLIVPEIVAPPAGDTIVAVVPFLTLATTMLEEAISPPDEFSAEMKNLWGPLANAAELYTSCGDEFCPIWFQLSTQNATELYLTLELIEAEIVIVPETVDLSA